MTRIFKAGKTLGLWFSDLCGQRWVYWALVIWTVVVLWSGILSADINYWLIVGMVIGLLMIIIGHLLRLGAVVVGRGDATVAQAIWAHFKRKWETRPTLGVFLRGPQ